MSNSRKAERRRFIDQTFKMPSELQEIEKINNRVANMLGKNKERTKKIESVESGEEKQPLKRMTTGNVHKQLPAETSAAELRAYYEKDLE